MRAAHQKSPLNAFRDAVLSKNGPEGGVARCVALALASQADTETLETYMGIPEIAKRSGFCERTVRAALIILRASGWIVERTRERGRPVLRTAVIPQPPAADAAPPRQEMPYHPGTRCRTTPADGASEPRQTAPDTPASAASDLSKSLLKSLGAASPSPATAVSAALEARSDEVMRMHGDGLQPSAIAKRLRGDHGVICNTSEVLRLIARATGVSTNALPPGHA